MDKDTDKNASETGNLFSNFVTILTIVLGAILNIELGKELLNTAVTKTTTSQYTVQLTEPIQQDSLSYVTIAKNTSEARYISKNREEVAIPLANDCRIFHKSGKQNKISYTVLNKYNVFNKKIDERATKVTIYKAPAQ